MKSRTKRKVRLALVALPVVAAAGTAAFLMTRGDDVHHTTHVALVDQTSFGANHQLDLEATRRLTAVASAAAADKGQLIVVDIGGDTLSTRVEGTVSFNPDCANPDTCRKADKAALNGAATLIGKVVSENQGAQSTDLFGALNLAGSICHEQQGSCQLDVISDGDQNDQELSLLGDIPNGAATTTLIEHHRAGARLPDLSNVTITWSGLGTDGGTSDRTAALAGFWNQYLTAAGANSIDISRAVTK